MDVPLMMVRKVKLPLIGVGAPAAVYLPPVAARLGTDIVVPADAGVASAVGAVVGNVVETVHILIQSGQEGFVVFSPWSRRVVESLDEAKAFALELARTKATERALEAGATSLTVATDTRDKVATAAGGARICLGTEVAVTVSGPPRHLTAGA
jgi:N-methylhydantoinase A/oxoprolinase/acetone carboxylase beta subunit